MNMKQFPVHFKEETFTLTLKMKGEDESVNHTLFPLHPHIKETYRYDSTFSCPEPRYRAALWDQPGENPRQPHSKETYLYDSTFSHPEPHYRAAFQDLSDNPRQPCIQETYFHSPGLYAPRPEPHYRSAVFDQPCDNPRTFNHPETPYRPTVLDQPCDNPRQPHIKETYLHESNFSRPEPHYRPIFQDLFSDNPSTQYLKPTLDIKGTKCSDTVYRNPPVWADSPFAGLQNLPTVDDIFGKNKKKKNKRDIKKENAVTRHIEEIRRKQNKIDKIDNDDSMKTQLNIPGMVSSKTVYRTSPVWAAPNTYLPHPPTGGPAPDEPYGLTKARVKYCDFRSANSVSQHLDELKRKQSK
eukprot:XP_017945624.1 PREDICTED: uncharacterized protein LOC100498554 [Xenopus tropicalis]